MIPKSILTIKPRGDYIYTYSLCCQSHIGLADVTGPGVYHFDLIQALSQEFHCTLIVFNVKELTYLSLHNVKCKW